jgi:tRNA threonylcarbamoyl adenosine modification protein YeaZ
VKLLAVDTALGACSVAVLDGARALAHRIVLMDRGHAEALAPMVEETMAACGFGFSALDRLAVTTGPGTFTGQRVGLAFARGLRVALGKPLIGVTTLAAMNAQASDETHLSQCAALHDARRDEVYLEFTGGEPHVLAFEDAIASLSQLQGPLALSGTAAPAVAARLPHATLSTVRQPDALWVARLAQAMPDTAEPPRPLYLRAPDAKLPGQK